ncbi:MAG: nucleotidyltransferase substrate binding protein [Gammaproteobacteria bacterium]|nr:nucleotidyltransferase substrate binding protein [Gammaproteobacteria bacterium]
MLDFSSLKKAVAAMNDAVANANDESFMQGLTETQQNIIRAGVIQNFEFTYELCWKMMQRWIKLNISPEDANPRNKRDLFRIAARYNLLNNPDEWFEYNEARNMTSHTYDEDNAEYVFTIAVKFIDSAKELLQELQVRNG